MISKKIRTDLPVMITQGGFVNSFFFLNKHANKHLIQKRANRLERARKRNMVGRFKRYNNRLFFFVFIQTQARMIVRKSYQEVCGYFSSTFLFQSPLKILICFLPRKTVFLEDTKPTLFFLRII